MTELQKMFEHAVKKVAVLFKESGELTPMWHAVDRDGENLVICTPWHDSEEKYALVERIRELFNKRGVKRYIFMSEGWTLEASDLEQVNKYIGRFAEHPDRREVLTVQGEDCNGSSVMGMYYILRPEHAPATLSPFKTFDGKSEGTLTGLLR